MSESFTGKKMLDMAVQIEQRGYDFYDLMEINAESINLKKMYSGLKKQEQRHVEDFKRIEASMDILKLNEKFNRRESFDYFQAIYDTTMLLDVVRSEISTQDVRDEIADIQIAISYEKDKILFMEKLITFLNDVEEKIIKTLIQEDKERVLKLLKMKNNLRE